MITLDALGPGGTFRAARRTALDDVTGRPAAELGMVPPVFVGRACSALRRAEPLPAADRVRALAEAGRLFGSGTPGGLTPAEYDDAVSRVGGLPITEVRQARRTVADRVARAASSVAAARPDGAVADWREPSTCTGAAVWTRRGEVFAVLAAGNHPGTHSLWPEALALGYRVAIRPSRREPFTPHRLVAALRAAGFGDDHVVLLPTDHAAAEALLRGGDRAMVYGGDEVVARYAGDPAVLTQGPGRSKVLIGADTDWQAHLPTIVSSVAGHAGTGCVNATAVLVEGDPAPVAAALAERLAELPSLPPGDARAQLPVQPAEVARRIDRHLRDRAAESKPWLGGDGIADELGDGSAVLRPAVHQVDRCGAPQLGVELPFPCVWVGPWKPEDGMAPLRDTLALTAITGSARLVDRLVGEPGIANVFVGDHPTHWIEPGIPHDDYLATFLMRSKAVIRDAPA